MADNTIKKAFVKLHLAVLIAGGTGLFGRLVSVGELPLVCIRVVLAALMLATLLGFQHRLKKLSWHNLWRIMGCGIPLSIHWVFYYGSIKAANVSIGAICFALVGFLTAIIEPIIDHRRPRWKELFLGILTVLGIGLIFGLDARYRLGIGLGVISSLIYTFFSIYSKRVQASSVESSSTMLLYELIGGAIILIIATPFYAKLFPNVGIIPTTSDWLYLILFSSVFTIAPFLLQLQALRHISAFSVNLTYNLEPVYTILLAMILFGEATELNISFYIGILLIISSVALQVIDSIKSQNKKQPTSKTQSTKEENY